MHKARVHEAALIFWLYTMRIAYTTTFRSSLISSFDVAMRMG